MDFRLVPCVGDVCIACNDGIDNDGDGKIDYPDDPVCWGPTDKREARSGRRCGG